MEATSTEIAPLPGYDPAVYQAAPTALPWYQQAYNSIKGIYSDLDPAVQQAISGATATAIKVGAENILGSNKTGAQTYPQQGGYAGSIGQPAPGTADKPGIFSRINASLGLPVTTGFVVTTGIVIVLGGIVVVALVGKALMKLFK